jgi:hypothetical protein
VPIRNKLLQFILMGMVAGTTGGLGFAADAVFLAVHEKNQSYDIEGSFDVEAGPSVVWDVLTGYEKLTRTEKNRPVPVSAPVSAGNREK